ncbi:MAG: hypothetical protein HFH31_03935 [Bacilli bacterium]|nr:hypothetical protein [Bacilli bacterium]
MKKNEKKFIIVILVISMFIFYNPKVNAEEMNLTDDNTIYFEDVVNAGHDTGYSKENDIKKDDPHYGWLLGKFAISGFSGKNKDDNGNWVLLKNVGDKVTLYFNLLQDINKLNGNRNLKISNDKNGYDNEFKIRQTNFKKGTLIIRKIDASNNKNEPQIYVDYLNGVKKGANTKIEVFEEGDYEVALDYEIVEDGLLFFDSYHDYRIRFTFSVRNGNCMVFPIDVKTHSELVNTSVTENGFYLDLANSKYLSVNIKKEVLKEGGNGLVEDVRFNRPAKVGDEYTEEGIYTITVKNEYTKEQTIKKIYVGKDSILKAHVQTGYSISDVKNMVKLGATIDENGNIDNIPKDYQLESENSNFVSRSELNKKSISSYVYFFIPIVLIIFLIIFKMLEKKKEKN